jgi:hypothetical protein
MRRLLVRYSLGVKMCGLYCGHGMGRVEQAQMDQLNVLLCQGCRSETYFCMVSQTLNPTGYSDGSSGSIGTIDEAHLNMNWGQATVYLQRKN